MKLKTKAQRVILSIFMFSVIITASMVDNINIPTIIILIPFTIAMICCYFLARYGNFED